MLLLPKHVKAVTHLVTSALARLALNAPHVQEPASLLSLDPHALMTVELANTDNSIHTHAKPVTARAKLVTALLIKIVFLVRLEISCITECVLQVVQLEPGKMLQTKFVKT